MKKTKSKKGLIVGATGMIILLPLSGPAFNDTPEAATIPDSQYVRVNGNGNLEVNGKRERFWAVIGKPFISANVKPEDTQEIKAKKIEKARKGTDRLLKHFEDVGFNAVRLWQVVPNTDNYEIGDGSLADSLDYFIAKCKEKGFKIWAAGVGNNVGSLSPEDVNIIDEPETAQDWIKAIGEYNSPPRGEKTKDIRHSLARIWDERIEAVYIKRMRENATHFNKYTKLRWSDDPVFAVWELTNEEWWIRRMVGGGWTKEPQFFRNKLIAKWNEWLKNKYKTEEKLEEAWSRLLQGESLSKQTIIFAPMAGKTDISVSINDANPHARDAISGIEQSFTKDDFHPQRARDVIEFLLELQMAHKRRCANAMKTFGKSCRLSPLVYDTGIGYEIQSQFLHQNADAVAHDAYINGWGPRYVEPDLSKAKNENRRKLMIIDKERISANDGPWVNWLLKPPGICQGVPWLEHNKTEGKPFLVYETQIQQPAKYRADFPLRLIALASIQDWDWISWHYFATDDDIGLRDNAFVKAMDITTGAHPQGYHFTWDEVQQAIMRQASIMWRNNYLGPALNPTKFIFGRKSLLDPDSMDYAGSYGTIGFDMLQTVYQYGVRIQIDPNRDDDQIIGPVVKFEDRNKHNPYTPTDEITFDWEKGYLLIDESRAIAFTGFINNVGNKVKFKNGIILKDVFINNPEGIFSPVTEDKKYIAFAFVSEDGKALENTDQASLSIMSTSFNSGFSIDPEKILHYGHPSKADANAGGLPVLVARVGATIESKKLNGMNYVFLDWNMKEIEKGKINDGKLLIPADKPVFIIKLSNK